MSKPTYGSRPRRGMWADRAARLIAGIPAHPRTLLTRCWARAAAAVGALAPGWLGRWVARAGMPPREG